jgi:trk system potassium uptake protein
VVLSGMSFAVLGLSTFGFRIAVGLSTAGARVIAVDRDAKPVQKIADAVTKAVQADVLDLEALEHLGVIDVDAVVLGFRSSFDTAVLLTLMLRKRREDVRIIAQVDSEEKAEALRQVGASLTVFPERDIADRVVKGLVMPDLVEHVALGPNVAVIEVEVPQSCVGHSLAELDIRARFGVHVTGVKHRVAEGSEREMLIAPPASTVLERGDQVLLLGKITDLDRFIAAGAG